jgi:hypothetical protein
MLHMLHWLYTSVASVFQTYVTSVLSRCCICYSSHTHMLQANVVNVSSVSDVCCSKCFMLQVLHQQALQGGTCGGGPLRRSGSCVRGKRSGRDTGAEHKVVSMVMAASAEGGQ